MIDEFRTSMLNHKTGEISENMYLPDDNEIFRQHAWYSYLNRKHNETQLVREIKQHYGKNPIIILGDWSKGKEQRGIISTPNKALTNILKKNFIVFMIDEFRTSLLNCKTEEINNNLHLPDKKGNYHEMHSILTYQTKQNEMGCINRDSNAVNNMIKIVKYFIQTGERLLKFRRDYDLETNQIKAKGDNPKIVRQTKRGSSIIKPVKGAIRA
jgi:hypothetical protein